MIKEVSLNADNGQKSGSRKKTEDAASFARTSLRSCFASFPAGVSVIWIRVDCAKMLHFLVAKSEP